MYAQIGETGSGSGGANISLERTSPPPLLSRN